MISRKKLCLRNAVIKFVNSLTYTQLADLYWIIKPFGSVRTARDLKYVVKVFFNEMGV